MTLGVLPSVLAMGGGLSLHRRRNSSRQRTDELLT
jgi:hypothetical protein